MPPRLLPPPPLLPDEDVGTAGSADAVELRRSHDLEIFRAISYDLGIGKALLEREVALAVEPGASEEALLAAVETWQSYRPNRTVRNLALFREIYTRPPAGVSFSTHITRIALRRHLQQASPLPADEIDVIVDELTSEEGLEYSFCRNFIPPPGIHAPGTIGAYVDNLRSVITSTCPWLTAETINAILADTASDWHAAAAGRGISGQVDEPMPEGERDGYSVMELGRMIKKMEMDLSTPEEAMLENQAVADFGVKLVLES